MSVGLFGNGIGHFTENSEAATVSALQKVVFENGLGGPIGHHTHVQQQEAIEILFGRGQS